MNNHTNDNGEISKTSKVDAIVHNYVQQLLKYNLKLFNLPESS